MIVHYEQMESRVDEELTKLELFTKQILNEYDASEVGISNQQAANE
jgi:hypothetical protein